MDDKNSGFTLLEVMISVAILAIAIVVLLSTHNQSLNMLYASTKLSTSTFLAKKIMEKIELEGFSNVQSSSGNFEDENYPTMEWESIISDTHSDYLKKIEVTVSWRRSGTERNSLTLTSYLADR